MVSQSLMQLVDRDRQIPREHHATRNSHSSTSRPPDESDIIVGFRTGVPLYSSRPQSRRGGEELSSPGPTFLSRTYSDTSRRRDRGSMSDSEQVSSRHGHSRSHQFSLASSRSGASASAHQPTTSRRPSAASRVSDRENLSVRFESPVDGVSSRYPRSYSSIPHVPTTSATDSNGFVPTLGQSSLLLSFPSGTPPNSAAVDGRGEDAAIHAPAPRSVSGRNNNIFSLWNPRQGR